MFFWNFSKFYNYDGYYLTCAIFVHDSHIFYFVLWIDMCIGWLFPYPGCKLYRSMENKDDDGEDGDDELSWFNHPNIRCGTQILKQFIMSSPLLSQDNQILTQWFIGKSFI
jgi:hypothetical protein